MDAEQVTRVKHLTHLRPWDTPAALRYSTLVLPVMSSVSSLKLWVQEQYKVQGLNHKREFVGKKLFKAGLIATYPASNGEKVPQEKIRQLVNKLDSCLAFQSQLSH